MIQKKKQSYFESHIWIENWKNTNSKTSSNLNKRQLSNYVDGSANSEARPSPSARPRNSKLISCVPSARINFKLTTNRSELSIWSKQRTQASVHVEIVGKHY